MQGRGFPTGPPALRRFGCVRTRSVRLAARTLVFQAGNGGSIPPRTTGIPTRSSMAERAVYTGQDGVRVPPGRLLVSFGAQVLAAAFPALTRKVRVQVPRALLDGWRTGVWCNGSMAASKSARCGFESYCPC